MLSKKANWLAYIFLSVVGGYCLFHSLMPASQVLFISVIASLIIELVCLLSKQETKLLSIKLLLLSLLALGLFAKQPFFLLLVTPLLLEIKGVEFRLTQLFSYLLYISPIAYASISGLEIEILIVLIAMSIFGLFMLARSLESTEEKQLLIVGLSLAYGLYFKDLSYSHENLALVVGIAIAGLISVRSIFLFVVPMSYLLGIVAPDINQYVIFLLIASALSRKGNLIGLILSAMVFSYSMEFNYLGLSLALFLIGLFLDKEESAWKRMPMSIAPLVFFIGGSISGRSLELEPHQIYALAISFLCLLLVMFEGKIPSFKMLQFNAKKKLVEVDYRLFWSFNEVENNSYKGINMMRNSLNGILYISVVAAIGAVLYWF